MVRQSLRNAINRSIAEPKYKDLSDKKIDRIQYREDCEQKGKKLKVVSLKLKISKKKSYKVDEGSPKMRFKALNNVFDEVWVTKENYT